MSDRKTTYHSQLSKPTRIKVESDAIKSKYAKGGPNDPGYYYLFIEIDGNPHTYSAENESCAQTLASYKGGEVTVEAHGRGKEASFSIKNSDGTVKPEEKKSTIILVGGSEEAMEGIRKLAKQIGEVYEVSYAEGMTREKSIQDAHGKQMPPEQFQAMVSSIFINLSNRANGLIGKL